MFRPVVTYFTMAATCGLLVACGAPTKTETETGRMSAQNREHVALAAEASGNTELAMSMYAEAAAEAPGNSGIQLRYAAMLMKVGKVTQAREILTRSLANASDPMEVRRGLGMIDVMSGLHGQAIAELDKILSAHPKDVPALVDKAVALDLAGKHGDAQALYRIAQGLTPDDPAIANNLALSLALDGRTSDAKAVLLPFRGADALPERMKVTMKILDTAPDAQPDQGANGDEVRRLAVALATLPRGGNDASARPDATQH